MSLRDSETTYIVGARNNLINGISTIDVDCLLGPIISSAPQSPLVPVLQSHATSFPPSASGSHRRTQSSPLETDSIFTSATDLFLSSSDEAFEYWSELPIVPQPTSHFSFPTEHAIPIQRIDNSKCLSDENDGCQAADTGTPSKNSPWLSTALAIVSKLHSCLLYAEGSSFDNILSIARSGLRVCAESSQCTDCPTNMVLLICIAILKQVDRCYDILTRKETPVFPNISLKVGTMEFHGISSPDIVSTILGIERRQGATVCAGLEKLTQSEPNKKMTTIWGLLSIFRERFVPSSI